MPLLLSLLRRCSYSFSPTHDLCHWLRLPEPARCHQPSQWQLPGPPLIGREVAASTDVSCHWSLHWRHTHQLMAPGRAPAIVRYPNFSVPVQKMKKTTYCGLWLRIWRKCPESGLWSVVFIDLIIYRTTKSLLGNIYTNKREKTFYYSYYSSSSSYYSSVKIFPATSQCSSSETTEQIVKCHTILEMGSHDLSQHAFRSGPKGPKKGFKKTCFGLIFCQGWV